LKSTTQSLARAASTTPCFDNIKSTFRPEGEAPRIVESPYNDIDRWFGGHNQTEKSQQRDSNHKR
jgi:hypothetical protein